VSIARMLKVTAIGHGSVEDQVVGGLQDAGVIEISRTDLEEEGVGAKALNESRLDSVEERVADAQFVRDFLARFREPDVKFGAFIGEKIHLSEDEYLALRADERLPAVYRECVHISDRLGGIDREKDRLESLIDDLGPWAETRLQMARWRDTDRVVFFTGVIPEAEATDIRQELRECCDEVSVAEVGSEGGREAWIVMAHRDCVEDVRASLALTDFQEVSFPEELEDYPAEEIAIARDRLDDLAKERAGLVTRAEKLAAEHYEYMFALVQSLLTERDNVEVRTEFAATDRTFVLTGWIQKDHREKLGELLAGLETEVDLSFEEPERGEDVPVELVNGRFVKPFQIITDLYGRPSYWQIDPTPLLAGFFFVFFGICIGDFVYGLMLIGGALYIKHRLDVAPGVKAFMDLIVLGGVASMIVGVLTRSYLALPGEKLPEFLQYEPLLDPLPDLMFFLGLCIVLGVIHITVATIANAYLSITDGRWIDALSEDVSVLLFIYLTVAAIVWPEYMGVLLGIAFAQLILLKSRALDVLLGKAKPKSLIVAPFKGLLGVYGLVNYGSDLLSYTRLAALGLASLMVGDAMNRMAGLAADIPYAGLLAAALIVVVGHTFNVVISLLGAFVHPTRLQYVEFFGKFYEAGGRNFAPFSPRTERLVLRPREAGGEEGG
jgi:V/A-type H+-transporting ATPase subunit I